MPITHRVAVLGFSGFERDMIASVFRLAHSRTPRYEQVSDPSQADFLVADADHAPSVQLVAADERLGQAVFIGAHPPAGSLAWMARPIDTLHVMRELDAMVAMAAGGTGPAPFASATVPLPAVLPAALPASPPTASPLPSSAAAATSLPRRPRPPEPAGAGVPPPRPSALLVDDSAIATRFLESRLERWGLDISRASNSKGALALLEERDFDFVFLDVELGTGSELDGLALCQHIKRHSHDGAAIQTAVVMVSAHHSELDRVRGALAGCDAYLGKPLDEVELHRLMLRHGMRPITAAAVPPVAAPPPPG